MKHDAVIDSLPLYVVSDSAKLDYREKETWMKLDWNESPRNASPHVTKAIRDFLDQHSLSYYPDVTARGLIAAIAERFNVPPRCISIFNGSDNALQHIFYAFLTERSVFTTIQPTYTQIIQFVKFKRPGISYFEPDDVFNLDLAAFERACLPTADVAYLINPHNPTGHLLSREYLQELAQRFPATLFVIDEAYMEFASTDESCIDLVNNLKNLIVTRTFSKAYGLAGIRLGFAVAHADNIELIQRIKNNKDINTLAQIAGEAAIKDIDYLQDHVRTINSTKAWFIANAPEKYRVIGSEGNFVLIDYSADDGLIERLKQKRVLVRDRSDQHGLKNFLRITIGTQPQMEQVVEIMRQS